MIGLLGKKLGMTHVYDEYGRRIAVTAVQAGPCTVLRVREPQREGYRAVQVGFEPIKEAKLRKPLAGQFKKLGQAPFRYVREFRLPAAPKGTQAGSAQAGLTGRTGEKGLKDGAVIEPELSIGQQLTVGLFEENELVDVTGTSIGKGFQGGMRRWNWKGGPATHGSTSHRRPGSIGSSTTPGRVFRGHHLPGHMGHDRVTVQNLRIIRLDAEKHLLLVEGAIPGVERSLVIIRKCVKHPGLIRRPQVIEMVIEEDGGSAAAKKAKAKKK